MITKTVEQALVAIRGRKPLILNLTNIVTMEWVANVLLASGAAPLMTESEAELKALVSLSSSVYLNIGTLNKRFLARADRCVALAKKGNKPMVLDPVGAGASTLRTEAARTLMKSAQVIKGNASEIMALYGGEGNILGVESMHKTHEAQSAAILLAKNYGCVVVVSGALDFVTDGDRSEIFEAGSPWMSQVTGMGCALGAVIAAFLAVIEDPFTASCLAVDYYGFCGALAEKNAQGPGSFRVFFMDAVANAHALRAG